MPTSIVYSYQTLTYNINVILMPTLMHIFMNERYNLLHIVWQLKFSPWNNCASEGGNVSTHKFHNQ